MYKRQVRDTFAPVAIVGDLRVAAVVGGGKDHAAAAAEDRDLGTALCLSARVFYSF